MLMLLLLLLLLLILWSPLRCALLRSPTRKCPLSCLVLVDSPP